MGKYCYIARQVPYCPAKTEAAQRFELTAKKAIAERVKNIGESG
jgi:hypothetical protein